jgi:hypothetical protein
MVAYRYEDSGSSDRVARHMVGYTGILCKKARGDDPVVEFSSQLKQGLNACPRADRRQDPTPIYI